MRVIPSSELIINPDGSIFHLHLHPDELADTVIMVGDPARTELIASRFDTVEHVITNREFTTRTGHLNGKRLSVISTGIGCDNIDIVMTELDALCNIDLKTRTEKLEKQQLTIIRLGTSGAVQDSIRIGDYVMSEISVGIDGLLNFYAGVERVTDTTFESEFIRQTGWDARLARPYAVHNDAQLLERFSHMALPGITISAGGFYAPQGRVVRLPLHRKDYLERIEQFTLGDHRITNFEMEGSAIAGLAALMGHKALTICAIIAQRNAGDSRSDYHQIIDKLVSETLKTLTK